MFLGIALGAVLSTLIFIHSIPPGTEVSIGTVKLKGRGHTIENIISTEDIITDVDTKKEIRQKRRAERREK